MKNDDYEEVSMSEKRNDEDYNNEDWAGNDYPDDDDFWPSSNDDDDGSYCAIDKSYRDRPFHRHHGGNTGDGSASGNLLTVRTYNKVMAINGYFIVS
jgi:hypothetical protein